MGKKTKGQTKEVDLTAARDARCVPLAFEFLGRISQSKAKAGNIPPEELQKSYNEVALEMLRRLLAENVLISEIGYIQKVMNQIVEQAYNVVNLSLNNSLKKAEVHAFGKLIADVSFGELDAMLISAAEKEETKKLAEKKAKK